MAYFKRTGPSSFLATGHTGGAWDTAHQHIAPLLGLLAHLVEADRDARGSELVLGRLSYDILGTVPVEEVQLAVRVLRPGRTIELVEATAAHGGRDVVLLRAWLVQERDTAALAGDHFAPIPAPERVPLWDMTSVWPGGFIESVRVRRTDAAPGRAVAWVRTPLPLLEGEPVSELAAAAGLLDIANGLAVRVSPAEVAFPNVDLTAHLFRAPRGPWLGFDTSVSFGRSGLGVTSTVLHDLDGPLGTLNQVLTIRP